MYLYYLDINIEFHNELMLRAILCLLLRNKDVVIGCYLVIKEVEFCVWVLLKVKQTSLFMLVTC